jgi:hypothetical protein
MGGMMRVQCLLRDVYVTQLIYTAMDAFRCESVSVHRNTSKLSTSTILDLTAREI